MTPFEFIIVSLSAWAILDLWFNEDSFLIEWRARTQEWEGGVSGFFGTLLNCFFCFSHHVPWILIALLLVIRHFTAGIWHTLAMVPIYSLAATRLITLGKLLLESRSADTFKEDDNAGELYAGSTGPDDGTDATGSELP